jgi:uncharacterized protein DUF6920
MAKVLALVALVVVVLVAGALFYASSRWDSGTVRLRARLEQARVPITPLTHDPTRLDRLPAPVARYLRLVLRPGQPMIAGVHLRHTGTFNLSDSSQRWAPFTSDQRVITHRPGFDWDARIAVAPGFEVRVHDAYIDGEGLLHAALLAMFPLVIQRGTREMAEGELMRFLAESPWYPTVLLPDQGVRWEPLDDRSAVATLGDGRVSASLVFRFAPNGLLESVRSETRGRLVAGVAVPTPWLGRWSDWRWVNGVRIPTRGEVSWLLPAGPLPYWRGQVTAIDYDLAR